jgi:hypothetical protein
MVDCFAETTFLRRFDPGVTERGFWATASSQPTEKQMHSIRFFPINNLVRFFMAALSKEGI